MINLLLVDDQPIVRDGLKMILELYDDINIVTTAANGVDGLEKCKSNEVDVVLLDIRMPVMNGVEATKAIKALDRNIKIIILTTFDDDDYIFEALKSGASSYLLKDVEADEIVNTIRAVFQGKSIIQPAIASIVLNKLENAKEDSQKDLTQRELDIIRLIATGMSNKEVASNLYLTEGTVKNYVSSILSKLSLRHRTQIALYAVERKII